MGRKTTEVKCPSSHITSRVHYQHCPLRLVFVTWLRNLSGFSTVKRLFHLPFHMYSPEGRHDAQSGELRKHSTWKYNFGHTLGLPPARTLDFLIYGLPKTSLYIIGKTSACLYHLLINPWTRKAYLSHPGLVLLTLADKGQMTNSKRKLKDQPSQLKRWYQEDWSLGLTHLGPESGLRLSPEVLPLCWSLEFQTCMSHYHGLCLF